MRLPSHQVEKKNRSPKLRRVISESIRETRLELVLQIYRIGKKNNGYREIWRRTVSLSHVRVIVSGAAGRMRVQARDGIKFSMYLRFPSQVHVTSVKFNFNLYQSIHFVKFNSCKFVLFFLILYIAVSIFRQKFVHLRRSNKVHCVHLKHLREYSWNARNDLTTLWECHSFFFFFNRNLPVETSNRGVWSHLWRKREEGVDF